MKAAELLNRGGEVELLSDASGEELDVAGGNFSHTNGHWVWHNPAEKRVLRGWLCDLKGMRPGRSGSPERCSSVIISDIEALAASIKAMM